ncbi:MAG: SGNH/GDSL hydrolase family protein [Ardenticatenaceae bacterium]
MVSVVVTVVMGEFFLRLVMSPPPSYEEVIARTLESPERMFSPNRDVVYNIDGLYQGASEVSLRTSDNRFIEPEPDFPATYRVLFLGGSTTEAIYVPEDERWVALLNEPGVLAAYNAGQSGANTLDKYFTFLYLTEEKDLHFDLVVLMTAVNDLGWHRRLSKHGGALRLSDYQDALRTWYIEEYKKNESLSKQLQQQFRLIDLMARAKRGIRRLLSDSSSDSPRSVAAHYRKQRDDALSRYGEGTIPLSQCACCADELNEYAENARKNLTLLAEAVAATNSKLLVLSEANSHLAPAGSFYEDFRQPIRTCDEARISNQYAYTFSTDRNQKYLQAAEEAGAFTFDFASHMDAYANGPNGGQFMYDSIHYTSQGCAEVARLLRPVLLDILMTNPEQ